MDEVFDFLKRHENVDGKAGELVRCCLLLYERAENMPRADLVKSAQMQLFLDCLPAFDDGGW